MTTTARPLSTQGVRRPTRTWRLVLLSVVGGTVLAVAWSPHFVDRVIANGIGAPLLGDELGDVAVNSPGMAVAFAFITGFAGMFTACNVAVFSALAPLAGTREAGRGRLASLALPIGWMLLGAIVVGGTYGAFGVLVGGDLPQLSDTRLGDPDSGLRVRSIQSAVVFGLIGVFLVWRGLAYVGTVRNPLAALSRRFPAAEMVFIGALAGAFLAGRPYGPFRNLFEYAVSTGNPALGFLTFALQSIGNILGVALLFLLITVASRGRFQRWLAAKPDRMNRFAAAAFIVAGTFFIVYWTVKLANRAGVLWWPTMPYN